MKNPYLEKKRTLRMAVEALNDAIACAKDSWTFDHLIDVQQRLDVLYMEACDDACIWESRLAYHVEHDTLDLY